MQFNLLHIARPLNITFLLIAISSLHLVGFESSLINFTCPHFCPQLFIGPYYENLNLLFDYWLLPLEACGFLCVVEHSRSHKWLLHTRFKVLVLQMSSHLADKSFLPQFLIMPCILQSSLYGDRNLSSTIFFFFFKLSMGTLAVSLLYYSLKALVISAVAQ